MAGWLSGGIPASRKSHWGSSAAYAPQRRLYAPATAKTRRWKERRGIIGEAAGRNGGAGGWDGIWRRTLSQSRVSAELSNAFGQPIHARRGVRALRSHLRVPVVERLGPAYRVAIARREVFEADVLIVGGKMLLQQITRPLPFQVRALPSKVQEEPQLEARIRDREEDPAIARQRPGRLQPRVLVHVKDAPHLVVREV